MGRCWTPKQLVRMMKRMTVVVIAMIMVAGCYHDNKEEIYQNFIPCTVDTTVAVTYSADIGPLLTANCAIDGCHNSSSRQSELDLSTYADAKVIADDGRLENRINGIGPIMPPSGSLRLCDIEKIEIWINEGAPNN